MVTKLKLEKTAIIILIAAIGIVSLLTAGLFLIQKNDWMETTEFTPIDLAEKEQLMAIYQSKDANPLGLNATEARKIYDKQPDETQAYKTKIIAANENDELKTARALQADLDKLIKARQSLYLDDKAIIEWANDRLIASYKKEMQPSLLDTKSTETVNDEYYYYLKNVTDKTIISNLPQLADKASASEVRQQFHTFLSEKGIVDTDFSELLNEETTAIDVPAEIIRNVVGDEFMAADTIIYETYTINKAELSQFVINKQRSKTNHILSNVFLVIGLLMTGYSIWLMKKERVTIKKTLEPISIVYALASLMLGTVSGLLILIFNAFDWMLIPLLSVPVLLVVIGLIVLVFGNKAKWESLYKGRVGAYVQLPLLVHWLMLPVLGLVLFFSLIVIFQDDFFSVLLLFATIGIYLFLGGLPFLYRYQQRRRLKRAIEKSLPRNLLTEFSPEEVSVADGPQTAATLTAEYEQVRQLILHKMKQTTASETLKTDLLTNVSHDLRTPLTAIISYSDLLQATALETSDQQKYLTIIQEKAQRMNEMITDLFEVTKMDNGAVALHYDTVDMVALVQQIVGEYSEEATDKRYALRTTYPQDGIKLRIDANKIWRVLDNLLKNCMKYSLPESRIYLKVSETATECRLIIKNISRYELNEDADLLIERFKRGKADEARQSDGHGLGLAIVASIVNLHKGTLDISVDGDMFKVVVSLPKEPAIEVDD